LNAYVTLSVESRANGHPIHQAIHAADRWIAATAIALGAPLLTADKMFDGAPGLTLAVPFA
jgi:predicted nucleic acid-binding protein